MGINWEEIFAFGPQLYLQLSLAFDIGLGQGRLPQH